MKDFIALSIIILILNLQVIFPQDSVFTKNRSGDKNDAQLIVENYLDAIGGRELLSDIEDRITFITGVIEGKTVKIKLEQKLPNRLKQTLILSGIKQIIIFDGNNGIQIVEGKKIAMDNTLLSKIQSDAQMNQLLNPDSFGNKIEFAGIENIDGIRCYKLSISNDSGLSRYQFYSINSGFKIKELKEIETEHGIFMQETYLYNYKKIGGLKFPLRIKQKFGNQTIEFVVDSIKLNSGLDDNIFVIPDE